MCVYFLKHNLAICHSLMVGLWLSKNNWWRWVESNYRSIGYEPIALTAEPHRQDYGLIITKLKGYVKRFFKNFDIFLVYVVC